jgi:hypothetical protein
MLISAVTSHEVYREVTLETLTAVFCATVRDSHCHRCGELNRYDAFDDAVVSVSRDFVVCRLKMDVYLEMVFAGGLTLRSAFHTHVKACAALLGAERGRMRGGLGRRQLSECFAWFYMLLGDAPGSQGSSAALPCPRCCTGGIPKTVIIDGTTACCCQGTLPDYDQSSRHMPGMTSISAATQRALTNLHEREGVRFLLRSLKQAIESGEVGDIDIGHAVGAERTAAIVRPARTKAVLELVEAGDHEPILGKSGALTGARSAVGMFLQSLLLFLEGDGDDRADVSRGAGTAIMRRMFLMGAGTAMMRRIF